MSDTKASYTKIGVFIALGVALLIAVLIYIGGVGIGKRVMKAETYFVNPVSGLDVGSAVNFRGVKVGAVSEITFIGCKYEDCAPEDSQIIYVEMTFDAKRCGIDPDEDPEVLIQNMLKRGIHATVSASGVTGLSRIELNYPTTPIEDRNISWVPNNYCIPPAPSILQSAADSATRILDQINRMDLVQLWTNLVNITGNANGLLESSTTFIESQRGTMNETLQNMRDASENFSEFSREVRDNPGLLLRDRQAEPLEETKR